MVTEEPLEQAIYHFSGTNSLEIYTIVRQEVVDKSCFP